MATLRNRRKLASKETPENTGNNHSQNMLNPGMAEKYITQVSQTIEGKVTKNFSQEFSWTELSILGALSKLDEFLLSPQVWTCYGNIQEQQLKEPATHWGSFPRGPCPKVEFFACRASNLTESDQEETHHS